MDIVQIGYYTQRRKARVPIDRGALKASFGERPQELRAEFFDGFVVLTDVSEPAWRNRNE
jgi:hypothetical protein